MEQPSRPRSDRTDNTATMGQGSRITFTMGGPGGPMVTLGGANTLGARTLGPNQRGNNTGNQAPTMSECEIQSVRSVTV